MDNKHFIWIVPLILIIGFIIGYVSGLSIPKNIEFGMDEKTINYLQNNSYLFENNLNLCSRKCIFITYDINNTDLFRCEHE